TMERRRLIPMFATVMGAAVLLITALHGIEAAAWAGAFRFLGRQQVGDALFAQRYDDLRPRKPVSRTALADDGRLGGAQRNVVIRADDGLSVRDDPGGLAARPRRAAAALLRSIGRAGPALRGAGHLAPEAALRTTGPA